MTTLLVETGAGIVGANAYVTEEAAAAYHTQRPSHGAWVDLDDADSAAGLLVDATRRLDAAYSWRGTIATTAQGLALPRLPITLSDGRVLDGAAQVALAADAVSALAVQLWQDRRTEGRVTRSESETLGAWSTSATYADSDVSYPEIDQILEPLIDGGGMGHGPRNFKVVRWS